ncbi:hypothetical protein PIB30_050463 [Stylosanthes scabra]|uniref:Uncharacterized protein n=1 Tax=Stylosanthes scabra TaxID=79078 RepID=A0ABU6VH38_9FABA|nr:hypothetical protein [Stylosanthes scabra]
MGRELSLSQPYKKTQPNPLHHPSHPSPKPITLSSQTYPTRDGPLEQRSKMLFSGISPTLPWQHQNRMFRDDREERLPNALKASRSARTSSSGNSKGSPQQHTKGRFPFKGISNIPNVSKSTLAAKLATRLAITLTIR